RADAALVVLSIARRHRAMTRIARAAPVASFIEAIARVWRMASRTSCGAHARTIAVLALLPTSSRFLA
ncbi:hypothetical protein, partial [Burkholderia pseudomallei]|uniref:hypothetical protein n=1 Tax=Burkholderia pseudomallei TaxID=28450 RepID=UPI001C3C903A